MRVGVEGRLVALPQSVNIANASTTNRKRSQVFEVLDTEQNLISGQGQALVNSSALALPGRVAPTLRPDFGEGWGSSHSARSFICGWPTSFAPGVTFEGAPSAERRWADYSAILSLRDTLIAVPKGLKRFQETCQLPGRV
jgi:hypothetical protein